MTHAISDQFTTVGSSGWSSTTKLLQATSVGGSNSTATQVSYPAASTGNTTVRMVPEGTATTTAIPAAPAAWSGTGWASPVLDGANVHAVTTDTTALTVTFVVANSGWTTAPTVTWTVIAYLGEPNGGPMVEIGRATSGAAAAGTVTVTITPGASQSSTTSTSPRLCFEIFGVVGIGVGGIGTNLITVATAGTTARLSTGGAYTSQWARNGAITTTPTTTAARKITAGRTATTSSTPTPALGPRSITVAASKAVTTAPTTANRKAVTVAAPKAVTTSPTAATPVKAVTVAPKAVTTAPTPAASRRVSGARSAAVTTTPTTGFARAVISARSFAITSAPTTRLRLDIPEEALERIAAGGTPDWPQNAPLKAVAGVTRDSAGAIVTSATVKLIRQTDDVTVATATSHATTGAYSFSRGTDDPNSYRVLATKAGAPEIHGVTNTLVPA